MRRKGGGGGMGKKEKEGGKGGCTIWLHLPQPENQLQSFPILLEKLLHCLKCTEGGYSVQRSHRQNSTKNNPSLHSPQLKITHILINSHIAKATYK